MRSAPDASTRRMIGAALVLSSAAMLFGGVYVLVALELTLVGGAILLAGVVDALLAVWFITRR